MLMIYKLKFCQFIYIIYQIKSIQGYNTQNMQNQKKKHRFATNIMVYFRIKRMVRRWIKLAKNSRHRFFVIKQWTETQKNYLKDLRIIQQNIKMPIVKRNLMSSQQVEIVFSYIDVITQLSQKFYQDLSSFQKNWNPYKTMIGPNVIKIHSFFKIYVEYCNKYSKAQAILKQMKKQDYNSIRERLPMDIESYMIKPVQRPLKYKLLLEDYLKHMPPTHDDYKNIKIAVQKYRNVNQTNNEGLQKQTRKQKMFALSKLYQQLLTSTRELIKWFDGKTYEKNLKIYIFNDLIMVTYYIAQNFQYLYKLIFLDSSLFVIKQIDGHYFDLKLFVCGKNDCITIMFQNIGQLNQVNRNILELLNKLDQKQKDRKSLIQSYYNKSKIVPKVRITLADKKFQNRNQFFTPDLKISVVGIQLRPVSSIKEQLYYVLKYELLRPWKLGQYAYIDFQKLQKLYNKLTAAYYSNTRLPPLAPIDDFPISQSKKTGQKITELRRLTIQEFLNYALRNNSIMRDPRLILQTLNIQQNLWNFSNQSKERCNCKLCYNGKITLQQFIVQRDRYIINSRKMKKSDYCIKKYMNNVLFLINSNKKTFNTCEKKLLYLELQEGRIDYSRLYRSQNVCIDVDINLYTIQNQSLKIIVHQKATIGEIMNQLSRCLKISLINDFGLFFWHQEIPRILDPDELIYPIYLKIRDNELQRKDSGIFSKIKAWGNQLVDGKKSYIFLRKYIFLDRTSQELSFSQNIRKYRLVINQILYDIKNEKINLNENQLIQIASLFICLSYIENLNQINDYRITSELLKKIIPNSKQYLFTNPRWKKIIISNIDKFKNKCLNQPNKIKILFDMTYNIIKDKLEYTTYYFNVKIKDTSSYQGLSKKMIAGVNYKKFLLQKQGNEAPILDIPIPKLRYFVNAEAMYIKLQDKQLKLERLLLYSVSRLIQKYKQFWNHFGEQIKDQI